MDTVKEITRQAYMCLILRWLLSHPLGWAALTAAFIVAVAFLPVAALGMVMPAESVWEQLPPEVRSLNDDTAIGPAPEYTPPKALRYREIDPLALMVWLERRGSYLAGPEFVAGFIEAGRRHNIDPRLLVAITGAEQSFVPRRNPSAWKIAQNPFNVFGCWCSTSIGFATSARIAAATVARLSQDMPPGYDAIRWLSDPANPRGMYATGVENEGKPRPTSPAWNWIRNVSGFFAQLRRDIPEERLPESAGSRR